MQTHLKQQQEIKPWVNCSHSEVLGLDIFCILPSHVQHSAGHNLIVRTSCSQHYYR